MRISQRDIADRLSLSTATVSKSLQNDSEINPSTRAQVIMMATQMGYQQRRASRKGTRSSQTRTICLLLQSDSPIGSDATAMADQILAGMSAEAHALNTAIIIHYVPFRDLDRISESAYQPVALREGMLSGMVLCHRFPPSVVKWFARQLPCVEIVRHDVNLSLDYVDVDAHQAIGLAFDHLYGLGHRRIGFLGPVAPDDERVASVTWYHERFAAYIQCLVTAGLKYDPSIGDPRRHLQTTESAAVDQVVEQTRQGVTAWITASDPFIGYPWVRRLMSKGLRVPQDVSITGFDATVNAPDCPRLTSVRVPFEAMGRAAVTALIRRIDGPAAAYQRIGFAGHLVEAETTCRAPDTHG